MDLPDPAELWDYRLRLQRHGFRSDEPPSDEDRHTALGDARWAKRIYERVFGS